MNKEKKKRKTEENKCERNGFILISLAYASALFYGWVERFKKKKDRRMSEQEQESGKGRT